MKNVLKSLLILFICMICLTGCGSENKYIKEIGLNELKGKVANKESFALYVGNEGCSHCNSYRPTLEKVLNKYKITIYHLDNSKLTEEEYNDFKSYHINGTPTIAFFEHGEEETTLNRIVGEASEEDTIEVFKTNGYIK